jgi:hypothetical protein
MNRDFSASSRQARSILAVAAIVATMLVVGSIEGLSQHYGAEAQFASAKPITVAHR